jgi:hypothetical protein
MACRRPSLTTWNYRKGPNLRPLSLQILEAQLNLHIANPAFWRPLISFRYTSLHIFGSAPRPEGQSSNWKFSTLHFQPFFESPVPT